MKTSCDKQMWSYNHTESQEVFIVFLLHCLVKKMSHVIFFNYLFTQFDKVFNLRAAVFPVKNTPFDGKIQSMGIRLKFGSSKLCFLPHTTMAFSISAFIKSSWVK